MKSYLILSILISSLFSIHAGSPQIEKSSSSPVLTSSKLYFANGVYYFDSGFYYNTTSGVIFPSNGQNDKYTPYFTTDQQPFSLKQTIDTRTNEIVSILQFLTPNLTAVTASYEISRLPDTDSVTIKTVPGYISFEMYGFSQQGNNNFSLVIFDLTTKTFFCNQKLSTINHFDRYESLYTNGSLFVYGVIVPSSNFSSYFVTGSCSSNQTTISRGLDMVGSIKIQAFNSSSVFVNYFFSDVVPDGGNSLQIGVYNSTNHINFGPVMQVMSFKTYNDTHMFIQSIVNGVQTLGLYVISPALQFVQVASFNFGLYVVIDVTPLSGTNKAIITLEEQGAVITYDFNTNSISQVATFSVPVTLANGSVINSSQYGYFIQSPGEPIYFVPAPYSNRQAGGYQAPSDLNQTYTLYVPSVNYNDSNNCLLTHFNASSSTINQFTFPSCPLSLATGNPITIKDVKFASDGTPYVCYRDAFGSLFIVNTAGSVGPFLLFNTYSFLQVSMNLTNGTANFAGTQLTSFVLGRINLTTGTVLTTQRLGGSSVYNVVTKLTDRYYLLAFTGSTSSVLAIYDMVEFNQTYKVNSAVTNEVFGLFAFWPYGFSEENPSTFSGLLFIAEDVMYAVNNAGKTLVLVASNSGGYYFNDVAYVDETRFAATLVQDEYIYFQQTFEIASWGNAGDNDDDDQIHIETF